MSNAGVIGLRSEAGEALERGKYERSGLSSISWHPRANMSFAQWVEHGRKLGLVGRSVGWWIGDWLYYGNAAYGERYARATRLTGLDVQTLMNMVYVASRFDASRRREKLSWSHHAEVAALEPELQDRWLDRAETDRLSVRCLREEIRRERRACLAEAGEAPVAQLHPPSEDGHSIVCPSCGHAFPRKREREVVDQLAEQEALQLA